MNLELTCPLPRGFTEGAPHLNLVDAVSSQVKTALGWNLHRTVDRKAVGFRDAVFPRLSSR